VVEGGTIGRWFCGEGSERGELGDAAALWRVSGGEAVVGYS
jgi:hypothetical protein